VHHASCCVAASDADLLPCALLTLTRHCVRALVLQVRQAKLRMPSWENVEEAINFTVLPKGSAGTEKPELFGTHSSTYSLW